MRSFIRLYNDQRSHATDDSDYDADNNYVI